MGIITLRSTFYFQKLISFLLLWYIKCKYYLNLEYVAQWVYPHLTGLAYLRYHKTVFPVSRVCLQ
jgi:hypothetical protein